MSRNCLSNEVVRVIKNPGLTGVGRWDDIDQVNRRPREASVSDQDGTHRHPQIIFDQLSVLKMITTSYSPASLPGAMFLLSNGGKAVKFE